jgi:sterol desaturase/sphingolipid hydroxylase (fatty acid hydroxylase superfamily)
LLREPSHVNGGPRAHGLVGRMDARYSAIVGARQLQLVAVAGTALGLGLALVLQRVRPFAKAGGSVRVNVGLWIVGTLVTGLVCGACTYGVATWAAARGLGVLRLLALPEGARIAFTVLGLDFVSYHWHRANHGLSFLWRFHAVHHSDRTFTVSTGLRFHPGELLLSIPVRLAAIVALGASPVGIVVFDVVFATANLVEHGDTALPRALESRLERLVVTSALHRRHHARPEAHRARNFGTIFTLWDRAAGTYGPSASSDAYAIGLDDVPPPTLARAFALPFQPRS